MAGTTVNTYVRRRQRSENAASVRRRAFALEQMLLRSRPIVETSPTSRENYPREFEYTNTIANRFISQKNFQDVDEPCKKFIASRRDLFNIVVRTITLVQRNRILQKHVNALRAETRRYLCSTLNNPGNRCQERRLQAPHTENILPFTEQGVSISSPSLISDSISANSHHRLDYAYDHNDNYRVDDDCLSDNNSED